MMRSLLTAIGSLSVGVCISFASLAATNEMDCGSDAVIDVARKIANGHPDNKLVAYIHYQSAPMHSGAVKALEDEANEKLAASKSVIDTIQNKVQDASRKLKAAQDQCMQAHKGDGVTISACVNSQAASNYKNIPQFQQAMQQILDTIRPLENDLVQAQLEALRARNELQSAPPVQNSYVEKLNRLWDAAKNNISYDLETIRMKARDADTGRLTCQAVMTAQLPEWGSAKMDVAFTVEKTTKGELYVEIYGLE
jgi:ribosomal protein S17